MFRSFDFQEEFEKKKMVGILVARSGRQLQRYNKGQRIVVGLVSVLESIRLQFRLSVMGGSKHL